MQNWWKPACAAFAAALLASCGDEAPDVPAANGATNLSAGPVAAFPDESLVTLAGTVVSARPGQFVLNYGSGTITVEMDDWDWYREGGMLVPGDRVTVSGRLDRNLLARDSIEASAVFVDELNTVYFASGADEEQLGLLTVPPLPAGKVDATGRVTAIEGREFIIGSPTGAVVVDTSRMADNPLDAQGSPQIEVGDRVYVWGDLDLSLPEGAELRADAVISLSVDRLKTARRSAQEGADRSGATANDPAPDGGSGAPRAKAERPAPDQEGKSPIGTSPNDPVDTQGAGLIADNARGIDADEGNKSR